MGRGNDHGSFHNHIFMNGQIQNMEGGVAAFTRHDRVDVNTALGQGAVVPTVLAASRHSVGFSKVHGIQGQVEGHDTVAAGACSSEGLSIITTLRTDIVGCRISFRPSKGALTCAHADFVVNRLDHIQCQASHFKAVVSNGGGDIVNTCFVIEVAMEFVREFACANRSIGHFNGIHLTYMEDDGSGGVNGIRGDGTRATNDLRKIQQIREVVSSIP